MNVDVQLSLQIGEELHKAMSSLAQSLGRLTTLLWPYDSIGRPRPLRCASDGHWVALSWYEGPEDPHLPSVMVGESTHHPHPAWPRTVGFPYENKPFWAIKKAKDLLVSSISEIVKGEALPSTDVSLAAENLWRTALAIGGFGSLYDRPIEIGLLLERLSDISGRVIFGWPTNTVRVDVDELKALLLSKEASEGPLLLAPFLPRDMEIDKNIVKIWDEYSEPQLLKKVNHTYSRALGAYESICKEWLQAFKPHMPRWLMMPTRLKGALTVGNANRPPALDYYLEPLPKGNRNTVDIEFSASVGAFDQIVTSVSASIRNLRPDYEGRLAVTRTHQMLDIFGSNPVTKVTYEWLSHDLRAIDWIK
jgi:hypothetical protein